MKWLAAAVAALAFVASAGAGRGSAVNDAGRSTVELLVDRWAGVYDTAEQLVYGGDNSFDIASDSDDRRVRTIVLPVSLPWLGENILYFEEFLHEDPGHPRRLMLLRLEPDPASQLSVRVRQFTFRDPSRWRRLYRDAELLQELRREDLDAIPSCDLRLIREGEHFRGGTAPRSCIVATGEPGRYIDYELLVGKGLYWYHKRILSFADDELLEEVVAFDWFELHEARLFTCRVQWKPEKSPGPLVTIATLDLHDQGGRARFTTPEGRIYELSLHSRDWPFDTNHDALILILQAAGVSGPLASSWTGLDDHQIAIELDSLSVSCGPFTSSDEIVTS